MKLVYDVGDKPKLRSNLVFALQQLLAIIAATILVPMLVNVFGEFGEGQTPFMSQSAALLGAGVGTMFYLLVTKGKSPVFLGSSFAFLPPLYGAVVFGYCGIFLGAVFAGLVYVIIALVIKGTGSAWVNKLLPPVVIGPTVALIGLSLCGSAVNNLANIASSAANYNLVHIAVGLFAFFVTVYASVKGSKTSKMIPFIIGIMAAYVLGAVLTAIGAATGCDYLKVIDFAPLTKNFENLTFASFIAVPDFTFMGMFEEGFARMQAADVGTIALLFAPVAFVVLAEHIADHKNLGSIIGRDLLTDPGLDKTLIGDGVGSILGSFFGGCPNTTYGESVGCVAITGNASVSTIWIAAVYAVLLSFFTPFVVFVETIPTCIIGGICIALYGFIAVSGLKMLKDVDLGDNRNLFVVAAILVPGIGGLTLNFGSITISAIATALVLGIIVNVLFNKRAPAEHAKAQQ